MWNVHIVEIAELKKEIGKLKKENKLLIEDLEENENFITYLLGDRSQEDAWEGFKNSKWYNKEC